MRRAAALLALAVGSACAAPTVRPAEAAPSGALRLVVLAPGDGVAALLLSSAGESLLVDGGSVEDFGLLRTVLAREDALPPDHVAVTAHRPGRLGGLVFLLSGRDGLAGTADDLPLRGALLDPGPKNACSALECLAWDALVARSGLRAEVGDRFDLGGGVRVRVVEVNGALAKGPGRPGPASLSLLVEAGACRLLLPGARVATPAAAERLGAAVGAVDAAVVPADALPAAADLRAAALLVTPTPEAPCAPAPGALAALRERGIDTVLAGPPPGQDCGPRPGLTAEGRVELEVAGDRLTLRPRILDGRPAGAARHLRCKNADSRGVRGHPGR